ncbi:MAG: PEF-CTERM sorting domain-containing protein [Candidatus Bathyarchaeia archaeon]
MKFIGSKGLISFFLVVCVAMAIVSVIHASVTSSTTPKLAIDTIHTDYFPSYIDQIAKGLGFEVKEISGNAIVESDLVDLDILVLYALGAPYMTQTEMDLILNFIEGGGGIYIVTARSSNPSTYYNVLYEKLGLKVSGTRYYLQYPDIKNVTFSHPIMDGVSRIKLSTSHYIAELSLLTDPAEQILYAENHALFLVSSYGSGRAFIDLIDYGIGFNDFYDNRRVVRNALIWLMDYHKDTVRVSVDGNVFDVELETNSVISSFDFNKDEKSITFQATGLLGTSGYAHLSVPAELMWGDLDYWYIYVDGEISSESYVEQFGDKYLIHVFYEHSTHKIKITSPEAIPEFPSTTISLLVLLLLAIFFTFKKKKKA